MILGFVRSRPRGTERFFQLLTRTQLFSHFIESRSLSSGNDAVLAFFDECTDRVRDIFVTFWEKKIFPYEKC